MSAPGKGGRWEPSVDQRKDWPESPGWGFVDGALRALDQQFSSGILLGEHLDSMSQSEAGSVLLGRPFGTTTGIGLLMDPISLSLFQSPQSASVAFSAMKK